MDIKDIHTGEGNYFDNICIDYDKAFALCDELFPHKRERESPSYIKLIYLIRIISI